MSIKSSSRKSCKDVFNAFLVTFARYAGIYEFPCIDPAYEIPNKLISFSKCLSANDYNQWVHFYEYDYLFERIWNNPERYLKILKRFNGVILPDFSLYRDMPYVMQLWNIYRSRAIGQWLQKNGIKVIPNIRFADKRTYKICCDGIAKHSVIAIGTLGTIKNVENRNYLMEGLNVVVNTLEPAVIIIYGAAPNYIFERYRLAGVNIISFEPMTAISHKEVV